MPIKKYKTVRLKRARKERPRDPQKDAQPQLHLFVNEACHDDVGSILDSMGREFKYRDASKFESTKASDTVLFMNCGGSEVADSRRIRRFVHGGGTVYASDHQAEFVVSSFPNVFQLGDSMPEGSYTATICDPGLEQVLGRRLRLNFDLPGWRFLIPNPEYPVKVYASILSLPVSYPPVRGTKRGVPIIVGYDIPNGGSVLFTAFHGSAQQSRKVKDLIRFLILRPVMSRDLHMLRLSIDTCAASMSREFVGSLTRKTSLHDFPATEAGGCSARLSWHGNARLSLEFHGREKTAIDSITSHASPILLTSTMTGITSVRVRMLESTQYVVPFCLVTSRSTIREANEGSNTSVRMDGWGNE
jgi:hypothetical protein